MNIVVEILTLKAQKEKEYCQFYGGVFERLIRTEIDLLGVVKESAPANFSKIRKSKIKKLMLNFTKDTFDKMLSKDVI